MTLAKKTIVFKSLLNSRELEFVMEAHNGLSAKIVENAGFKAIWASSFSIASSLGLRDTNEVSWTSLSDIVEQMASVTNIPVFVDGDSGHGNFNNVRLLVKKLSRAGAAALCIEDKVFPKINSYVHNVRQELIDLKEFCGKIKAAKDSALDDNFAVIARVEALIAGAGLKEALNRADAYHHAGADGIFIHSNKKDGKEIIDFAECWNNECPLVICPTKYYGTPTQLFRKHKISLVLWANHNLRASIKAMEEISKRIFLEESVHDVENDLYPIDDILKMMDYEELKQAEKIYSGLYEEAA